MENKYKISIIAATVLLGLTAGSYYKAQETGKAVLKLEKDTLTVPKDTITDVKDKTVLYIGDSHSANADFGWQVQLSKATGMKGKNVSIGGKMTPWMLSMAKQHLDTTYDYCFVYGGANDCFSMIPAEKTLVNLQAIANLCKEKGVKCVVLTGFDPLTCVKTNSGYPQLYAKLQQMMLTQLKDCQVVDCRKAVVRTNCWDYLCHMNYDGHKNIANCIVDSCKYKRITK